MKTINIITMILGGLLVLSGMMKFFGMLPSFEIHSGQVAIRIANNTSVFYIVVVNLIGGLSIFYHALSTLRFNKTLLSTVDSSQSRLPNMSKLTLTTAIISILIGIWLGVRVIVLFAGFEDLPFDIGYIFFLLGILIGFGPFCFFPIFLAGRNLSLSSRIGQINEEKRRAEIRAHFQSTGKPAQRRR